MMSREVDRLFEELHRISQIDGLIFLRSAANRLAFSHAAFDLQPFDSVCFAASLVFGLAGFCGCLPATRLSVLRRLRLRPHGFIPGPSSYKTGKHFTEACSSCFGIGHVL